jgi:hypothetical protein
MGVVHDLVVVREGGFQFEAGNVIGSARDVAVPYPWSLKSFSTKVPLRGGSRHTVLDFYGEEDSHLAGVKPTVDPSNLIAG